jgi:hypothetical protein
VIAKVTALTWEDQDEEVERVERPPEQARDEGVPLRRRERRELG